MKMIINLGWDDYVLDAPAAQIEGLLDLLNKAVPVTRKHAGSQSYLVHAPERAREFVGSTCRERPLTQEEFADVKAAADFNALAKQATEQLSAADDTTR